MTFFVLVFMHLDTKIQKAKQIQFLKSVLWLGISAFGGPQMHLPHFEAILVKKRNFITKDELIEISSYCNLLPGPSTTQTLTTIGFKLGGPTLAFLTVILWALPGAIFMATIAFFSQHFLMAHIQFLDSCVLAFMIYGTVQMLKWMKITALNVSLLVGIGVLGYLLRNPWFFPIGVLVGFTVSGFWGTSDVAKTNGSAIKIKWGNLILFLSIFSLFGMGSLYLKKYQKSNTNPIVLFENSYRLGSLSFGGGNVLAAMTMEQYVHHKNRLSMDELNLGIAMTQSSPGPNFNLSVFTNALAMQNHQSGIWQFIIGALVGFVGIFLPGTIIVFFTFPIWQHIQSNRFIQKAIPGIFSVSIGFILSACLVLADNLITKFTVTNNATPALFSMTVLILCLVMLFTKKIPTPFVVLFSLAFGWFVG